MHHQAERQEEHKLCSSLKSKAVLRCEVTVLVQNQTNKQEPMSIQSVKPHVNTGKPELSMNLSCILP